MTEKKTERRSAKLIEVFPDVYEKLKSAFKGTRGLKKVGFYSEVILKGLGEVKK